MVYFLLLLTGLWPHHSNAQEPTPLNCYSQAEAFYMQMSERVISLYQSATIDKTDFEQYRKNILERRDADLKKCAEWDQVPRAATVPRAPVNGVHGGSERRPASFNPAYEEIISRDDFD